MKCLALFLFFKVSLFVDPLFYKNEGYFFGGGFQGKGHFSIVFTISILAKDLMVTFVVFVPRALSHIPHWSHSNQIPSNRPLLLLLPLQSSPWRAGKGNWREKRSLDDGVTPRGKLSLTHTHTLTYEPKQTFSGHLRRLSHTARAESARPLHRRMAEFLSSHYVKFSSKCAVNNN